MFLVLLRTSSMKLMIILWLNAMESALLASNLGSIKQ